MKRISGDSAYSGKLPLGCQLCAKGGKMVLFISGICDAKCFYCPLSENRKMKDVLYADEMPISGIRDAILEGKMIDATGTGITGGDPLKFHQRTSEYIRNLKEEFGKNHHIHLYTISGTKEAIDSVASAGLDEIRFHPPEEIWHMMERSVFKDRVKWARDAGLSVGIEVPSLPGTRVQMASLIDFARKYELDYVNLNELEFSETNAEKLIGRGYSIKNDVESGARGSREVAMEMIRNNPDYTVHYCSASFKDGVQMRNRLKRRAKNVAGPFDVVTKDGTIIRGIIESDDLEGTESLLVGAGISVDHIRRNAPKGRIEIPPWLLEDIKGLGLDAYEVEEYPTWDSIEVERVKIA
ncbi:MAG: 4Fe-4S cluster-binding domain-containing protein [Candidatus Thermoplasmatota archaeon]|nr:4Fe-4S cluster-binding domain-containing protein [Candidatus Thermoplasmatota archaeon]MCL5438227.1 4Fe-4S cluster-binding domain-containing protein [Candidatus Thermoplasmatota archaeon]